MKKHFLIPLSILLSISQFYAKDISQLEDITVTAQKSQDKIQNTSISISVLDNKNIKESNIIDTQDIVNNVPGLTFIRTNHHGVDSLLSIRGITPTMGGLETVGFFVDDVYNPMFDGEILDIKRIEVLKGPQGTLYGKNTEAGVINIITNQPQNEDSAEISLGFGNFGEQTYSAIVNKKLIEDKLLFRGAVRKRSSHGYYENDFKNDKKSDKIDGFDLRTSFTYLATPNLDVTISYDRNDYNNGYTGFNSIENARKNPGHVNVDLDGYANFTNNKFVLKSVYEDENFNFTSITAKSDTKNKDLNDVDFTTSNTMILDIDTKVDLLSQEFRIDSSFNNLKYLIGTYISKQEKKQNIDFTFVPYNYLDSTNSKITSNSFSLFTQTNYTFNKYFNITTGFRYDREKKKFNYISNSNPNVKNDKNFEEFLPKVALNFNIADQLIYASYSKGYKSGGFNPLAPTVSQLTFDKEESNNYELGVKTKFLNDKIFTNLAIYKIDIKDQQVEKQIYPNSITSNAAKSTIKGLEFDLKYQANNNLYLSAGYAYNNAKFDEYLDNIYDSSGNKIGEKSYKGHRAASTPKETLNLSARYNIGNSYILASLNRVGNMYHDLDNTQKEKAYNLVDLTLGTKYKNFDIKLWGKNIFNKNYITRAFEMNGEWFARTGNPRTFGIELSTKF